MMSDKWLRSPIARLSFGLLLALHLAGCGGSTEEEIAEQVIESGMPDGTKVEINEDGGNIRIDSPDGSLNMETGESVALPDNFPADLPIPEGIIWQMVQSSQADGKDMLIVQGSVPSPLDTVASSVRGKLAEQGWETVSTFMQAGEAEMLSFKKGDRELSVSISKDGEKTQVLYSVQ
jgi:hypothetical protein